MFDLSINRQEVERYLGYRGHIPDEVTSSLIEECISDLRKAADPRSFYQGFPIVWGREEAAVPAAAGTPSNAGFYTESSAEDTADHPKTAVGSFVSHALRPITIADMTIRSVSLSRNLKGCTEAVLLAATAGIGIDRLIRRAELTNIAKSAVYQAAGAALIEAYVDDLNKKIIEEAAARGLYCRPRFSPGYGDVSLAHQKDFDRILSMQKRVGIILSDSLLMTPSKSVTAIIGLSPSAKNCILAGCEECEARENCEFARN